MKRIFSIIITLAFVYGYASAWSGKGHQIVAYIAKRHLNDEAYNRVNTILGGTSMVYYASWLDYARDNDEYAHTSTWHYINVDEGQDYDERESLAYTDAVTALYGLTDLLSDRNTSAADAEFAVKAMTHIVGDLHQPLHAGHKTDLGGNYITVYYQGSRTNLHSFWDYNIVESAHPWGYYDWALALDVLSDEEQAEVTAGNIDSWAKESVAVAADIYKSFPSGSTIDAAKVQTWTPVLERQLLHGGLRLASLLNSILSHNSGIDDVQYDAPSAPVIYYDVTGRAIEATSPDDLPRGLYIRSDGTKILRR